MRGSIIVSAVLLGLSYAKPTLNRRYVVKESHPVPSEFSRVGEAPGHHLMRLQIGVKQGQFEVLEKHLWEISDPDHARYGKHLSLAEVNDLVKPADESTDLVREWLHEHVSPEHIESSPAGDFLSFTLPIAKIEEMLQTNYSIYQHEDGTNLVRTHEWSLPLHLHEHISAVQPTTAFIRTFPQAKTYVSVPGKAEVPTVQTYGGKPTVEKVCDTAGVTPLCLRTLYGTVDYKPKAAGRNQIGLANYLGELNNRSDAATYLKNYRPEAISGAYTFKQISVANGSLQQTPETPEQLKSGTGVEGALDVQTILGVSWPTPLLAWSTGGAPPPFTPDADNPTVDSEPYLTWVNYVLRQPFVPQVISNSYEDNEQTVPLSYAKVVCSQFAQLSARGVSVIFGSGDGGVGGVQPGGSCKSNVDGSTRFIPLFPSSCPYVTSIGATVGFSPEVAAYDPRNKFSTGGGFSNYFPQPAWQAKAVSSYLHTLGDEFEGLYNKSGRAYPDLSVYGVNYTIIWNGTLRRVDGTSAATPTAAGIFALLNDALIAHGKPTLGFLNPWLYKKGKAAFVDVTSGSALGCNMTGFPATKGWDPVTGFGTPRFDKLLKAVGL
ncbi:subtilisin-like protein [Karstenula rhodostoma CBS 690.94]|uniref:tripeptidyl-peptidase II n=1 Tax=Karstenula rhodostoma CBS 690.94 TaxID=1392251 RepID=A0A9P4P8V3_9PLEO|nr:subtilisin-like protein [Karstenula rhodostoma CBS 690.94]